MRFFSERRLRVAFVDLAQRPVAAAELRRFAERFGPAQLIDSTTAAYREAGLQYIRLADDEMFAKLLVNQALLRLPLVRAGTRLSVGIDERAWRSWLAQGEPN